MRVFITVMSAMASVALLSGCGEPAKNEKSVLLIGNGQMPNLANDKNGNIYLTYGIGDSVMYATSVDQGKTFSAPALVAVIPELAASHMRGPQVAVTARGVIVLAANKAGNIFSYTTDKTGKWQPTGRVNDVDTVAKEGLMSISADGQNAFAVWLDARDKHNTIEGAKSTDAGKTWSKNKIVYASPDTTVCECCKPSVVVDGKTVYVMFRNHLHGNRDMYLIQSADAGDSFGEAKRLGTEHWALNGCPMDGGGLAIDINGSPATVWRRKAIIYAATPGQPEIAIGEGKGCSIESVNGKNVYAWTENGQVVISKPTGTKLHLGKGQLPLLKRINNQQVICVWENEKNIYTQTLLL